MARYFQIVRTAPVDGAEAEFNRWYDEVHVPEVLQMPGFLAGQRFRLVTPDGGPGYLAAYEIESADIAATLATIRDSAPSRTKSPAIDVSQSVVVMFEAIGPRQLRRGTP